MHITPVLAWGFLGPVKELNELCKGFKVTFFIPVNSSWKYVPVFMKNAALSIVSTKNVDLSMVSSM